MEQNKARIVYLDFLRILAIFAVVILHVAAQNFYNASVTSASWHVFNIADSLVRWGVPVFVMISGALFLKKDQPILKMFKRNILKIFYVLVAWAALYTLWGIFVTHTISTPKNALTHFVTGHYHLWFLYMLIGIYIAVPILNKIVADKTCAIYFVVLAFLCSSLIPQCIEILGLEHPFVSGLLNSAFLKTRPNLVVGYFGYFVLGHILNITELTKKQRTLIYALGIGGAIITVVATAYVSLKQQTANIMFYGDTTINVALMAAAVFVFAKTHLNNVKNTKALACVLFLSKCSFGVYLVHAMVMEFLQVRLGITTLSFNPILSVPVLAVVIFLISLIISAVLNKIPLIKKLV